MRKGTVESYLCLISEEDAPVPGVVIRGSMLRGEPAKIAAKCEEIDTERETHVRVNQAFIGA